MKSKRPPCVNFEPLTIRDGHAFRPVIWCWKRKTYIKAELCDVCQHYKPKEPAQ